MYFVLDHLRLIKDTAARSIQIWWKYMKLVQKGRNLKGPKAYYRVKVTTTRSKLYSTILKWRTLKGSKGNCYFLLITSVTISYPKFLSGLLHGWSSPAY